MCSSEVHTMWCTFCLPPLHSSMDFQAVSNTHSLTQPGLLIACFTSTMRQRISNEAVQSWGAEDDITVMWGVKLQEELAWMACPPRWTFPPTIPSTFPHTYPHSWKKNWPAQTRTKTEPHFTILLMVKVALDRRGLVWAAEGWQHSSCSTFCNLMEWVHVCFWEWWWW